MEKEGADCTHVCLAGVAEIVNGRRVIGETKTDEFEF